MTNISNVNIEIHKSAHWKLHRSKKFHHFKWSEGQCDTKRHITCGDYTFLTFEALSVRTLIVIHVSYFESSTYRLLKKIEARAA